MPAAARGDSDGVARSIAGRADDPDYCARAVREAQYHSVLPLLAAAVRAVAPESRLMHDIRASLVEHTGQVLRLESLLTDVTERLRRSGIPSAGFKGAALAWRHYRSPEQRLYTDVDLLVRATDMPAAGSVLRNAGLSVIGRSPDDVLRSGYGEAVYAHPGGGTIDLHWHVMREPNIRAAFRLDTEVMLGRSIEIGVDGRTVPVLDDVDMLIATATHACFDGGYRLGWLVDVSRMVEAGHVDPSLLARRCGESRTAVPVQSILDRTAAALGTEVPEVAGRSGWLAVLGAIQRLRPVEHTFGQAARGGVVFRASRPTTAASIGALSRLIVTEVLTPLVSDPSHRWRTPRADRN